MDVGKGGVSMAKEILDDHVLTHKLNQKLVLVEIEQQLIKISCGLIDDDMYTKEDAIIALMEALALIDMEQQSLMGEINAEYKTLNYNFKNRAGHPIS